MKKMKNHNFIKNTAIAFIFGLLFIPLTAFNTVSAANSPCEIGGRCEKLRATLRKLERNPNNLSRKQLLKQIRAACNEMRRRNCPGIANYDPPICFTDL